MIFSQLLTEGYSGDEIKKQLIAFLKELGSAEQGIEGSFKNRVKNYCKKASIESKANADNIDRLMKALIDAENALHFFDEYLDRLK